MVQMRLFTKQNRDTEVENKYIDTERGRWKELGDRD